MAQLTEKERLTMLKRTLGIILFITLIPLWVFLYLLSTIGLAAIAIMDSTYEPIYNLAGKPLDTKD